MPVHPDLTAHRAVDACGGTYSAEECEERWAEGHKAALAAACEAVKAADALTADLMEALRPFAEACAHLHPSQADDGLTLDGIKVAEWRRAYAAFSKAEGRS